MARRHVGSISPISRRTTWLKLASFQLLYMCIVSMTALYLIQASAILSHLEKTAYCFCQFLALHRTVQVMQAWWIVFGKACCQHDYTTYTTGIDVISSRWRYRLPFKSVSLNHEGFKSNQVDP